MHLPDIHHMLARLQRYNALSDDLNLIVRLATTEARDLGRAYLADRSNLARGKMSGT